jgi:hypothetical protein
MNPEYFIMVMPLLLITSESLADACACVLVAVLPWAGKFFQNAQFMSKAATSPGKQVALDYFQRMFHSDPGQWLVACQVVFSLLTLALSVRGCLRLSRLGSLTRVGGNISAPDRALPAVRQ